MKRIKRFNEALEELNNDTIRENISQIDDTIQRIDEMRKTLQTIYSLLEKFTSDSEESNDQIDESVIEINSSDKKLEEVESSLVSVTEYLNNYIEDGRKYLF